jgi:hypothetical protein
MTPDIPLSAVLWILVLAYVSSVLLLLMASYICLAILCTRDTHITPLAVFEGFFPPKTQHLWF